jgi:hypothetical protein
MREEGAKNNNPLPQLATVVSTNPIAISIGNVVLDKDNLYINSDLVVEIGDTILLTPTPDQFMYVVVCKVVTQ